MEKPGIQIGKMFAFGLLILCLTFQTDIMGQKSNTPTPLTLILDSFQEFKTRAQKDEFEIKRKILTTLCQLQWPSLT